MRKEAKPRTLQVTAGSAGGPGGTDRLGQDFTRLNSFQVGDPSAIHRGGDWYWKYRPLSTAVGPAGARPGAHGRPAGAADRAAPAPPGRRGLPPGPFPKRNGTRIAI